MRNLLTRLFYIGIFGLGISGAMLYDNFISKNSSTWEYIISITLAAFSIFFIVGSFVIGRKKRKK